jgi:hypothetical protein
LAHGSDVAGAKANIEAAVANVKKTVTKKAVVATGAVQGVTAKKKAAPVAEEGVTVTKTSAGATVRRVAVKTAVKA